MWGARIVVTAESPAWAGHAARSLTGFATSVIGCKCEAGIERELDAAETPDGRPGVAALLFAPDAEGLAKRLVERVGQTVLTCPTTACFNGLAAEDEVDVGRPAALLRRRLAGEQGARRQALLADPGDGGRVPRRGALRDRGGRRRREPDHPGRGRGGRPARRRGGGRRDARGRGRDPAVPGRDRAQRQQGRVALQGADGVDQPRAVPDAARAGRRQPGPGGHRVGARDRDRRARARAGARGDARRARRRGAGRRACRSRPATTAAASASTTSTCGSSCRDAHAHAARGAAGAGRRRGAVAPTGSPA